MRLRKRPKVTDTAATREGGRYADVPHEHDMPPSSPEVPHRAGPDAVSSTSEDDTEDTARLPAIAHGPEGVTVVEQPLGHAVGQ